MVEITYEKNRLIVLSIPFFINYNIVEAVFFDFDGVLVDSVPLKLNAYREIFKPFGELAVNEITDYHLANGGIDRYRKISYVLHKFGFSEDNLNKLADQFANLVKDNVIKAPSLPGMIDLALELKEKKIPIFIVSGTPQVELIEIVTKRNWDNIFNGVMGSPDTKVEISKNLVQKYKLNPASCIFIGDATTDFHTAREMGFWFIGVTF